MWKLKKTKGDVCTIPLLAYVYFTDYLMIKCHKKMIQTNHTTNNFFIKILRSPVLSIGRIKTWGKRKMQKQNSNLATYGLCLFTWEKIRKKMAKKNIMKENKK